jgi:hypothetical protein
MAAQYIRLPPIHHTRLIRLIHVCVAGSLRLTRPIATAAAVLIRFGLVQQLLHNHSLPRQQHPELYHKRRKHPEANMVDNTTIVCLAHSVAQVLALCYY